MKNLSFVQKLILGLFLAIAVLYFLDKVSNISTRMFEQTNIPQLKRGLTREELSVLFEAPDMLVFKEWSLYENKLFHFSVEVPQDTKTYYSGTIWEKEGEEYTQYSVRFIDTTLRERIFCISITEMNSTSSLENYIHDIGGYSGLTIEKKNINGIEAIATSHPQRGEAGERRLLFIRDGFFFEIVTRDWSTEDTERIWQSFKFLSN